MSLVHEDVDLTTNIIRIHDHAVRAWVQRFDAQVSRESGSQKMNVIFATPERALATLNKLLKMRYGDRSEQLKVAPYPYISIARLGSRYAPDRYQGNKVFMTSVFSQDKGIAYIARWPIPIDIDYQIDLWCRTVETGDSFEMWFMSETSPEGTITVNFSPVWEPWGEKILFTASGGVVNNTTLEGEEDQRTVRLTATLTVKGWLLMAPSQVPTVHRIIAEFREMPESS